MNKETDFTSRKQSRAALEHLKSGVAQIAMDVQLAKKITS
jgi:hypothetical protein